MMSALVLGALKGVACFGWRWTLLYEKGSYKRSRGFLFSLFRFLPMKGTILRLFNLRKSLNICHFQFNFCIFH